MSAPALHLIGSEDRLRHHPILRSKGDKEKEGKMRRMEKFYFVVIVAGILCLSQTFSSVLYAAEQNPCAKDIAKFCKNVKSDSRGIIRCLEEHESELSPACRDYEAKLEGPRGERREMVKEKMRFRQDCQTDISKFCKDVDPAQGGLVKCIYKFENEISAPCRKWIKADKEESGKTK
jgi:hypothetical protein